MDLKKLVGCRSGQATVENIITLYYFNIDANKNVCDDWMSDEKRMISPKRTICILDAHQFQVHFNFNYFHLLVSLCKTLLHLISFLS